MVTLIPKAHAPANGTVSNDRHSFKPSCFLNL